ncbi:MAG TPA: ABC transporter ATP-binding protein, partial [Methanotrichaceae archaeon]|nr:ABC transporter ATP-binding protein [Methanotrichaceae archaeon]
MDLKPKVKDPPHPRKVPERIESMTLEGVSFSYPGSGRQSVQGINLEVSRGRMVALVGENGSGKTTLIKLLARLYDPDQGRILINGLDLRGFRIQDLRREISILMQDYGRYNMTFKENIQIGAPEADDLQEVERAARSTGADQVMRDLPEGYDTVLGSWFEGSKEISPGQWQRVALARAFFRPCQIMVIDEPTSAMDPNGEAKVLHEFRERARDKVAIIISHRLSAAREADMIYFLSAGKIIESGKHDELVRSGGEYARLFRLQAEGYR